jgi:hypothetical protein
MVIEMTLQRRAWCLGYLLISTLLPAGLCAASLAEVKSVYLFPMANGLDQYLADRLTHDHVLQVVTDPKAADAMITDHLGSGFEEQLLKLRPELKPPPPPKPVKKDDADADKDTDKDEDKKDKDMVPVPSSFHNAKGTVFLVHARSQQVVWSAYQKASSHDPKEMERTAARIAKMLEKDLAPPEVKK